jgi:hypothetical protein
LWVSWDFLLVITFLIVKKIGLVKHFLDHETMNINIHLMLCININIPLMVNTSTMEKRNMEKTDIGRTRRKRWSPCLCLWDVSLGNVECLRRWHFSLVEDDCLCTWLFAEELVLLGVCIEVSWEVLFPLLSDGERLLDVLGSSLSFIVNIQWNS